MGDSKSVLKSTSLIGGSKVISIIFSVIKNKVIAILLGPTGLGLISALQSTHQLVEKFAALGINQSAVRDIAKANGEGDHKQIAKTIISLKRAVLFTGILGMIVMILSAKPLSEFTFGSSKYVFEIRLLAVVVFFNLIKGGQAALLQGMRRIKDLAKMTVWSSLIGTVLSIPILYFLEIDGVTVFLIALSFGQLLVSIYYAKRVEVLKLDVGFPEVIKHSKSMFKLGFAFMAGGLVTLGGTYLIRVIVIRFIDLDAAGIYQAATAISTMYIGIILDAMGKDFYPRLAAVANNAKKEIAIINEQTEIGMYLAAPGLLFTMALAPYAIKLLYSSEFIDAYYILQWMILGVYVRTISWPMGYLFISRGKSTIFFINQIVATGIHLLLIYIFIDDYGLLGTGMAFFLMYILHVMYMFALIKNENNFFWYKGVLKSLALFSIIFGLSFIILINTDQLTGSVIVSILGIFVSYFSLKKVVEVMEMKSIKELGNYLISKVNRK